MPERPVEALVGADEFVGGDSERRVFQSPFFEAWIEGRTPVVVLSDDDKPAAGPPVVGGLVIVVDVGRLCPCVDGLRACRGEPMHGQVRHHPRSDRQQVHGVLESVGPHVAVSDHDDVGIRTSEAGFEGSRLHPGARVVLTDDDGPVGVVQAVALSHPAKRSFPPGAPAPPRHHDGNGHFAFFLRLHLMQAGRKLARQCGPPAARGLTWSMLFHGS